MELVKRNPEVKTRATTPPVMAINRQIKNLPQDTIQPNLENNLQFVDSDIYQIKLKEV